MQMVNENWATPLTGAELSRRPDERALPFLTHMKN